MTCADEIRAALELFTPGARSQTTDPEDGTIVVLDEGGSPIADVYGGPEDAALFLHGPAWLSEQQDRIAELEREAAAGTAVRAFLEGKALGLETELARVLELGGPRVRELEVDVARLQDALRRALDEVAELRRAAKGL